MTTEERDRLDRLHTFPCIACGWDGYVEAHHCINQQHKKRDHMRTIPLCRECHTGKFSIHKSRKGFRAKYGHEEILLERTNILLQGAARRPPFGV